MSGSDLFIGLMSGTSLDGVDAVLADCSRSPPAVLQHVYVGFEGELRSMLQALCSPGVDEIERAGVAAQQLVRIYATAVDRVLNEADVAPASVRAIGAHGQTVRHRPHDGFSAQLNAPALLAELTGIDVVADFRSRDLAAGGQGAPLASIFHMAAFTASRPRAVINIGGISNLTGLPAAGDTDVVGFDCGPGNLLLDHWMHQHFAQPFDRNGEVAASAEPDAALLSRLLAEPFFDQAPPKSTGRELFSPAWLQRALAGVALQPEVVMATLARLTAIAIARAIERWFPSACDAVICGGGARNNTLLRMLQSECSPRPVIPSSVLGVEPGHVEALAFAWLAYAHVSRRSGNVPSVTGARGERVLGALYPA